MKTGLNVKILYTLAAFLFFLPTNAFGYVFHTAPVTGAGGTITADLDESVPACTGNPTDNRGMGFYTSIGYNRFNFSVPPAENYNSDVQNICKHAFQIAGDPMIDGIYYFYLRNGYWVNPPENATTPTDLSNISDVWAFERSGGVWTSITSTTTDTTTRIVDFTPHNEQLIPATGSTTPVNFSLHAYINPDDIGTFLSITLSLHNTDQNKLISLLSQYDIQFFYGVATTSGDFFYSSTTPLASGNYKVEASLERSYFGGLIENPLALGTNQEYFHQFIVGTSTLMGSLSQNGQKILNDISGGALINAASTTATSCNILSGFNVGECMLFLLVPDSGYISETLKGFKDGVAVHVPWGYITRFISILTSSATTSLPAFVVNIPTGVGASTSAEYIATTFDPADMIAGGGALLDSIHDPIHGKTARDIFAPIVRLTIALGVILTIAADLMKSHNHAGGTQAQRQVQQKTT
jgi:hypothetical protein